jgi:methionyl-tRNA synthetase
MGDYDTEAVWEPRPITTGVEIGPAVPLFAKLDPSVVDEELARLEQP